MIWRPFCIFFPSFFLLFSLRLFPPFSLLSLRFPSLLFFLNRNPWLMNAIWAVAPEYAALMNCQEQSGRNDLFFALLAEAGVQVEPNISTDNMIGISPDSGENFLLFDRVSTEMRATE